MQQGRVLIIAGSDSGGGAGIQADIKTVTCLGGYAASAVTALTAQDTKTVHDIMDVPPSFIAKQIEVVRNDIGADAYKTGMLHNIAVMETVAEELSRDTLPLVCDPVMTAKGGAVLLERKAVDALRSLMLPRTNLLTPNLPEATLLVGFAVENEASQMRAAEALLKQGARAVLVKGGHGDGAELVDILMSDAGTERFVHSRIKTRNTHGTGCTLASAAATGLALGQELRPAVAQAIAYVRAAIENAPDLGKGYGPLAHKVAHKVAAAS